LEPSLEQRFFTLLEGRLRRLDEPPEIVS